jgi:hypothetical protein
MKKYFLGWTNIKTVITEIVKTLTSKESRFSQKKILVYTIDLSMLVTSLLYIHAHWVVMTASDLCMITGMWLAKGVSNVVMSQGDKKVVDADGVDIVTSTATSTAVSSTTVTAVEPEGPAQPQVER